MDVWDLTGLEHLGLLPGKLRELDVCDLSSDDVLFVLGLAADAVDVLCGRSSGWFDEYVRLSELEARAVRVASDLNDVLAGLVDAGVVAGEAVVDVLSRFVSLQLFREEFFRQPDLSAGGGFDHPSGLR